MEKCAVILAAGDGKRMKSAHPKVMCRVLEQPMLGWVLDSVSGAGITPGETGAVVGSGAQAVTEYLSGRGFEQTFMQTERKGTGHAVMQAMPLIERSDNVLVLCGDAPFITSEVISAAYEEHISSGNKVTAVSAEIESPTGYGRIIRSESGAFTAIVEQKDCTEQQRLIKEINSGMYWFDGKALAQALPKLTSANAGGEYYLTDTVQLIREAGGKAGVFRADDPDIVLGANSRADLLALNDLARKRVIEKHLSGGVEFVCTDGVIIGKNVRIGQDTRIYPNTILRGSTVIGNDCVITGGIIENCVIGDRVSLNQVQAYDSEVRDGASIGPFAQLRPGSVIDKNVKIGDFVEIKNSSLGEMTSVSHLTYIGDSDVGKDVNFGCGCVTANYDGVSKFRTVIGDHAFIGCNTNLIAPVEIGENAATGAGTTVTGHVPADSLAVERADLKIKEHWEKNSVRKRKI